MRALKIGALVVPYLAAVVAANLLVKHYGPSWAPVIAFVAVAAVLIFRDAFADLAGQRWLAQLLQLGLIAVGALLTYLLNQDAALIAKASVIAFAASETTEQAIYFVLRNRPWMDRAPISALFAAAVDSVLFLTIAFGFDFRLVFYQWSAKVAGAWVWARLIQVVKDRREVLPRNA
jgi:uncharacterized PurR-regulated membrane protein YhhQ (DUF165 family)